MLKAADALSEAGYQVNVISTRSTEWAWQADEELRHTRSWTWRAVDYRRESAPLSYVITGLRHKGAQAIASMLDRNRCPLAIAARAYSRTYSELLRAMLAEKVDLFYGGSSLALAAVAAAGERTDTPYALDLEDFHSGEHDRDRPDAELVHGLAERIERSILGRAAFLTGAGVALSEAYREKYGVPVIPIHNTFPLPATPPSTEPRAHGPLRLYWFSQTIGPGRGLEDAIRAIGLAGIPGELHLRGRAIAEYLDSLRKLAAESAGELRIVHHAPASPDRMIELCREYDAGLCLEQAPVLNRQLSSTNKAFTYLAAGVPVVLTDIPGHRPLAMDLKEAAILYRPGDTKALAAALKSWFEDKKLLARAKSAAWDACRRRWHWEHPQERGALLKAVSGVLETGAPDSRRVTHLPGRESRAR